MNYIHVRNIAKFHPSYKDRTHTWAKIGVCLACGDPDMELITNEIDKWRFICFILLELQAKKPIPLDPAYLKRKGFNLKIRPIAMTIKELGMLLECVTLPDTERYASSNEPLPRVEESRVEESRREPVPSFKSPTQEEVKAYCLSAGFAIDAQKFVDYYTSNGWMVGKNKMKNWEAAARRWSQSQYVTQQQDDGIPTKWKTPSLIRR